MKHRIIVDENMTINLDIPEELNALEFRALTTKVNTIFKMSTVDIQLGQTIATMSRWTKEEDKFLVDNFGVMKTKEIGEKLDRTYGAVLARLKHLRDTGVADSVPRRHYEASHTDFSDDEVQFIKDNYQTMTYQKIAWKLGKSLSNILAKIKIMQNASIIPMKNTGGEEISGTVVEETVGGQNEATEDKTSEQSEGDDRKRFTHLTRS